MIRNAVIKKIRRLAWRLLGPPARHTQEYLGQYGCIRCAASFLAWNQIDGDYLEFGVYQGRSFAEAYRSVWNNRDEVNRAIDASEIAAWYRMRPRFIAFDSFCGLPGGAGERHADYGESAFSCSEEKFLANIRDSGVDLNDVVTVPGFYDQTLCAETKKRLGLKRASLVMIDCDLYESTVPVLEFITDLVGQGTIIIFDDWYRYAGRADKGEQRACREWLKKNPQLALTQYWQQGPQAVAFMVNKS